MLCPDGPGFRSRSIRATALYLVPAAGENHLRRITEGSGRDALLRRPAPSLPSTACGEGREGALGKHEAVAREGRFDTRSVMAMQGLSPTMGERNERRGSIALVLLVAAGLIAAAAGLMLVGRNQAGSYVMFLLAVLGLIGGFSLFALAAGVLRISGRAAQDWDPVAWFEH